MVKYYIVDYDYAVGDLGVPKQKLMHIDVEEGETIEIVLDSYFSDFFGKGTHKEKFNYQSYCYFDETEEQCIEITDWKEVPESHAFILMKYLH